jgi:hypothetical protein
MLKKDVGEPRFVESTQAESGAEPKPSSVASQLKANPGALSQEIRPSEAQIRELAFHLYEQRGCQAGHDSEDWLEAEAILSQPNQAA